MSLDHTSSSSSSWSSDGGGGSDSDSTPQGGRRSAHKVLLRKQRPQKMIGRTLHEFPVHLADEEDLVDWPLPTYYWPHNFRRFPLSHGVRGARPRGGYILETGNHERWESNAYYYLVGDGCRPAYEIDDLGRVIRGLSLDPSLRQKLEGWTDADIPQNILGYTTTLTQTPPFAKETHHHHSEGQEQLDQDGGSDGYLSIFRNQLKRWLQFRMWQASIRDYDAARDRRHAEFVDSHMHDTREAHESIGGGDRGLRFTELKAQAKGEYYRRVAEEGYKGTQKAVLEQFLVDQFKDNLVWDTLSPTDWLGMADSVFEKEIEGPHYREMLSLAGIDPDTVTPGSFNFRMPDSYPDGGSRNDDFTLPLGFDYFKADLEKALDRHVHVQTKTKTDDDDDDDDDGQKSLSLPLDHVNFQADTWQQDFFTTWVEYVYYECRTLDLLQNREMELEETQKQSHLVVHDQLNAILHVSRPAGKDDSNTIGTEKYEHTREEIAAGIEAKQRAVKAAEVAYNDHLIKIKTKTKTAKTPRRKNKTTGSNRDDNEQELEKKKNQLSKTLARAKKELSQQKARLRALERFLVERDLHLSVKAAVARQTIVRDWAIAEMFTMVHMAQAGLLLDLTRVIRKNPRPPPPLLPGRTRTFDFTHHYHDHKGSQITRKKKNLKRGLHQSEDEGHGTPRRRKSRRLAGEEPEFQLEPDGKPPVSAEVADSLDLANRDEVIAREKTPLDNPEKIVEKLRRFHKSLHVLSGPSGGRSGSESGSGSGQGDQRGRGEEEEKEEKEEAYRRQDDEDDDDINDLREAVKKQARETARARDRDGDRADGSRTTSREERRVEVQVTAATETAASRKRGRPSKRIRQANPRV